ncbi:MAG: hypothetical protein HYZ34_07230 [Ignavibacteriae bacterium]|nr:hypothetical protein [Ignavibacteriota bacterium]
MNSQPHQLPWLSGTLTTLETELLQKYGDGQQERLQRGLRQVANFWRAEDGDAAMFGEFVRSNFAGDKTTHDVLFNRFENLLEKIDGHMGEISRNLRTQTDLDIGTIYPFDEVFAGYEPSAHILDDFFGNKLAFIVLLNFPLTTLDERLSRGETWSRRQWAVVRLAQRFSRRVPSDVNLAIAKAGAEADQYIAEYNIWMHHVLNERGERLFPAKMRLLSHWNLRDEIKSNYSLGKEGLPKQRMIQKVMERIVDQTIPDIVVNNPHVDWNPFTNEVTAATNNDADSPPPTDMKISNTPEPDERYATLLKTFQSSTLADAYSPNAPTLIARRFEINREIPEARVKAMLEQVLASPLAEKTAKLIKKRLGRSLEPFDTWYNGFKPQGKYSPAELDEIVAKKYPTTEAYKNNIPALLVKLDFPLERANSIARNIAVDPARGSGHAQGAGMRGVQARLRTRVEKSGMNYKGYNIAVHEMGHNVEQTLSLNEIDHTLLNGVPNTAFTEALAFVFQGHDLELLGLTAPDAQTEALKTLNDFWGTYEIAGVALVDMSVWHWMYDNPKATPAELKQATMQIAKDIWNTYYAPIFNKKDVTLLGIYSHMIHSFLYLPDYPVGHLIAHQIEAQMKKAGTIGVEFERMVRAGNISPDIWMKNATGAPVGAEAMLVATEKALKEIK